MFNTMLFIFILSSLIAFLMAFRGVRGIPFRASFSSSITFNLLKLKIISFFTEPVVFSYNNPTMGFCDYLNSCDLISLDEGEIYFEECRKDNQTYSVKEIVDKDLVSLIRGEKLGRWNMSFDSINEQCVLFKGKKMHREIYDPVTPRFNKEGGTIRQKEHLKEMEIFSKESKKLESLMEAMDKREKRKSLILEGGEKNMEGKAPTSDMMEAFNSMFLGSEITPQNLSKNRKIDLMEEGHFPYLRETLTKCYERNFIFNKVGTKISFEGLSGSKTTLSFKKYIGKGFCSVELKHFVRRGENYLILNKMRFPMDSSCFFNLTAFLNLQTISKIPFKTEEEEMRGGVTFCHTEGIEAIVERIIKREDFYIAKKFASEGSVFRFLNILDPVLASLTLISSVVSLIFSVLGENYALLRMVLLIPSIFTLLVTISVIMGSKTAVLIYKLTLFRVLVFHSLKTLVFKKLYKANSIFRFCDPETKMLLKVRKSSKYISLHTCMSKCSYPESTVEDLEIGTPKPELNSNFDRVYTFEQKMTKIEVKVLKGQNRSENESIMMDVRVKYPQGKGMPEDTVSYPIFAQERNIKTLSKVFALMSREEFIGVSTNEIKLNGLNYLHLISTDEIVRFVLENGPLMRVFEVDEECFGASIRIKNIDNLNLNVYKTLGPKACKLAIYHNISFFGSNENVHELFNLNPGTMPDKRLSNLKNKTYKRYTSDVSRLFLSSGLKPLYKITMLPETKHLIEVKEKSEEISMMKIQPEEESILEYVISEDLKEEKEKEEEEKRRREGANEEGKVGGKEGEIEKDLNPVQMKALKAFEAFSDESFKRIEVFTSGIKKEKEKQEMVSMKENKSDENFRISMRSRAPFVRKYIESKRRDFEEYTNFSEKKLRSFEMKIGGGVKRNCNYFKEVKMKLSEAILKRNTEGSSQPKELSLPRLEELLKKAHCVPKIKLKRGAESPLKPKKRKLNSKEKRKIKASHKDKSGKEARASQVGFCCFKNVGSVRKMVKDFYRCIHLGRKCEELKIYFFEGAKAFKKRAFYFMKKDILEIGEKLGLEPKESPLIKNENESPVDKFRKKFKLMENEINRELDELQKLI